MRTRMILPPNLYGNMNETRILKYRAARHARRTKRYTLQLNGGRVRRIRESGSGRRGVRRIVIFLSGVTHDQAHQSAGQHDLEVILPLHVRDEKC